MNETKVIAILYYLFLSMDAQLNEQPLPAYMRTAPFPEQLPAMVELKLIGIQSDPDGGDPDIYIQEAGWFILARDQRETTQKMAKRLTELGEDYTKFFPFPGSVPPDDKETK